MHSKANIVSHRKPSPPRLRKPAKTSVSTPHIKQKIDSETHFEINSRSIAGAVVGTLQHFGFGLKDFCECRHSESGGSVATLIRLPASCLPYAKVQSAMDSILLPFPPETFPLETSTLFGSCLRVSLFSLTVPFPCCKRHCGLFVWPACWANPVFDVISLFFFYLAVIFSRKNHNKSHQIAIPVPNALESSVR